MLLPFYPCVFSYWSKYIYITFKYIYTRYIKNIYIYICVCVLDITQKILYTYKYISMRHMPFEYSYVYVLRCITNYSFTHTGAKINTEIEKSSPRWSFASRFVAGGDRGSIIFHGNYIETLVDIDFKPDI